MLLCMCFFVSVRFDGSVNCDQLPDGTVVLWFHLFLGLDIQHFCSLTTETCCRACVYQCVFSIGKYCRLVGLMRCPLPDVHCLWRLILSGQVYVAKVLGPDLRPFVRDLYFDEPALHCHVLHPQAGTFQGEQRFAGARVLGRPSVQIYTVRSINIMEGITT